VALLILTSTLFLFLKLDPSSRGGGDRGTDRLLPGMLFLRPFCQSRKKPRFDFGCRECRRTTFSWRDRALGRVQGHPILYALVAFRAAVDLLSMSWIAWFLLCCPTRRTQVRPSKLCLILNQSYGPASESDAVGFNETNVMDLVNHPCGYTSGCWQIALMGTCPIVLPTVNDVLLLWLSTPKSYLLWM
jgi:hypothetical protein